MSPAEGAEHPLFPDWFVTFPYVLTRIEYKGESHWFGCYAFLHDEDLQRALFFRTWVITGESVWLHPELDDELVIEIGDADWVLRYHYNEKKRKFVNESKEHQD